MSNNIKVVCRFRPSNSKEKAKGATDIVHLSDDGTTVKIIGQANHTFNFDKIWGPITSQTDVYDYAARPVVEDLFKGFNGTIFVYGQTGSGKTHTMQGPDIHNKELKGIIPRMIETIFSFVEDASETMEFLVKVSYIEIYMEKIRDLMAPEKADLKIRENKDKSVYIEGVTEEYVTCAEDVIRVMDTGSGNRKVAATNMNDVSSRSHSIFVWNVEQKNLQNGTTMSGKLYLVDLAGSEKVGKTGATGQTLDEAKGINKSLSALGNVINALTDGKSKHVPYRDSKLTRLLQESLGGNSRTTLIINCSPSSYNEEETLSTLRFGIRAKTIKNQAKVNKEMSVQELKALLDKANKEISRLKTYCTCLEEELRLVKGDITISPAAKDKAGASGMTLPSPAIQQVQSQTTLQVMSPDTRSKLPNVAAINDRVTELEDKLRQAEDEKSEILEKVDSLQDALRDREQAAGEELERLEKLKDELTNATATQEQYEKENQIMVGKIAELTIQMERLQCEKSESQVVIESLSEQKETLQADLQRLQAEFTELQEAHKKLSTTNKKEEARQTKMAALEENQKKYAMDSAALLQSLESSVSRLQDLETSLHTPDAAESQQAQDSTGAPSPAAASGEQHQQPPSAQLSEEQAKKLERLEELEKKLVELESASKTTTTEKEKMHRRIEELEKTAEDRAKKLEIYEKEREREKQRQKQRDEAARLEAGLESLADELSGVELEVESMDGAPASLGLPRPSSHMLGVGDGEPVESFEMEMLRAEKEQFQAEAEQLRREKDELDLQVEQAKQEYERKAQALDKEREEEKATYNEEKRKQLEQELNELRQKTAQKLAEFDQLKTSLLRDLQNRCEKVIDLEMLLDEAREQYEQLLKNSSNKSLQKRNMFLERNLEQLTRVHQQLVNQNNELRLEKKVSEKKLAARNERIRGLEVLLASAQEKLQQQSENHGTQVSKYKQLVDELKAKLDQAQARSRGRSSSIGNGNTGGARIIKPIRGGGGRKKPDLASSGSGTVATASSAGSGSLRRSSSALSTESPTNGKRASSKEKAYTSSPLSPEDFSLHSNILESNAPSSSSSSSSGAPSPYRPPHQSSE